MTALGGNELVALAVGDNRLDVGAAAGWWLSLYDGFLSVSSEASSPGGVAFSDDGTRMFVVDLADGDVHQYTLGTAWDVTTAAHDGFFSVSAQASGAMGVAFSDDGTRMFVVDAADNDVHQYTLGTAWDVTTAAHDGFFSVSSEASTSVSIAFSDDGTRTFVVDASHEDVHQWQIAPPQD